MFVLLCQMPKHAASADAQVPERNLSQLRGWGFKPAHSADLGTRHAVLRIQAN
jgi:hypothetical protein